MGKLLVGVALKAAGTRSWAVGADSAENCPPGLGDGSGLCTSSSGHLHPPEGTHERWQSFGHLVPNVAGPVLWADATPVGTEVHEYMP